VIRFACPNCQERYELHPALASLPLVCKQCGNRITPPAVSTLPESPPVPAPKPATPVAPAKPVAPPQPEKKPALPVAQLVAPPPASPPPSASTHTPPPATLKPAPASSALNDTNEDDDDDVFVTKPDSTPDIDFNVGGPTAASLSDAARARPAGLSDANRPRPAELQTAESVGSAAKTEPVSVESINLALLGPEPTKPSKKPQPVPAQPQVPATHDKPEPTLVPFLADLVVFVALVVVGIMLGEFLAKKPTGQVLSEAGSAVKFPPVDLIMWAGPPVMFALLYILLGSREKSVGAWLRRRKARQNTQ
jgi:hypothetical protein